MNQRHKDIIKQLQGLGNYPQLYVKQTHSNAYQIDVLNTQPLPSPGQIVYAGFDLADLLAIVRNVDIEEETND